MKNLVAILFVLFLSFAPARLKAAPDPDHIVVLISVDGLAHYYMDDPKADMPTIRQLAAEGVRAEKMKCVLPTVTWPNHTTLVTGVTPGRHGVLGNNYFDRETGKPIALIGDPIFNKDEIVRVPTIYDLAKQNGLKTAAVIWPASRGAKTLDWTVPDVGTNELFQKYGTPSLLAEFKQAGIPFEKQEEYFKANDGQSRDRMYVAMFNHIVRTHRPNLALLHLIEVDHVEHAYGPQSAPAYEAVKFADDRVREVWDEVKKDFPGHATVIIVSDHGFFPIQQLIQPNVLFHKEGLLDVKGIKIVGGQVRAVSQAGSSFIYILDSAHRDELISRMTPLFQNVEGIDQVLTPKDFKKFGLLDPTTNKQMADVVLTAKSGYAFSDIAAGEMVVTPKVGIIKGTHGYDPNLPGMHATFVAWGQGIKPGAKLGTMNNTDVAPTIADLLGLSMKDVEGKVLEPILWK